jgi:hypothetical protein
MRTLIAFLLLLTYISAHAETKCDISNLQEFKLNLVFSKNNESYSAKIFLPDINKTSGEFCGYWFHEKLTNNVNHQLYGYKDNNSYITLTPEIYDNGLSLRLSNNSQWVQEGTLGQPSVAGIIKIGVYSIVSK